MDTVTTLIATVGRRFAEPIRLLSQSSGNLSIEESGDASDSLVEWAESLTSHWRSAQRRAGIFTLFLADPLAPLVREWARRLDGLPHELELAIGLEADERMPDFYLVDPEISGNAAHWYLDHLAQLAPKRIVVAEPVPDVVRTAIGSLPYGSALPTGKAVADSARTYVPIPKIDPGSNIVIQHRTHVR